MYEEGITLCTEILDLLDEMPDNSAAIEFHDSTENKVTDIEASIEKFQNCTDNQMVALQNMKEGVEKWIRN